MSVAVSRPPRSWELQTWALLILSAASALAGLVTLVTLLGVRNAIATRGASGTSVLTDWVLRHTSAVDTVYFVLVLAYLAAFYWWRARTRQLLIIFGDSQARALAHWALAVWNVLVFLSFVIRFSGNLYGTDPTVDAVDGTVHRLDVSMVGLGIRLVALMLLLVGVWGTRDRVRRVVAGALVFTPPPLDRAAEPSPMQQTTILDTTTMATADDVFWSRVREMVIAAGDEVPLLESTSNLIRRWSLIPSASAVDTIRDSLPPGTVITVFPVPPRPGHQAPAEAPTEAGQWFGLTEDAGTGMLWFRLLQPSRVPDWLAKAKSAGRFGLYREDDPAALHAVTPAMARPAG